MPTVARFHGLMRQIVNRLYTFHIKAEDAGFRDHLDRWLAVAERWDEPKLDEAFLATLTGGEAKLPR